MLQSTEVSKIINNFRNQLRLAPDKDISILFEGDALDPNDVVKDTELAECDFSDPILLDVSVK
jgi:SUMO-like protein